MAKKSPKLISESVLTLLILLNGCSSAPFIQAEDVEEVVLDDAGFTKQDVDDLSTEETVDGFEVEFNTSKAQFIYDVSKKGIIQNREIIRNEEAVDDSAKTDDENQTDRESEGGNHHSQEEESDGSASAHDEQNQMAIRLALANVGLTEDNVTDLHVTREGEQLVVRFRYGDYVNVCRVDPIEERVISTFFE